MQQSHHIAGEADNQTDHLQDSHLAVSTQGAAHAVAAVVVALPEEGAPAGAPERLAPAAEWRVRHSPHSTTAAETRHQEGRQQGPGGGGVQVWCSAVWGCGYIEEVGCGVVWQGEMRCSAPRSHKVFVMHIRGAPIPLRLVAHGMWAYGLHVSAGACARIAQKQPASENVEALAVTAWLDSTPQP